MGAAAARIAAARVTGLVLPAVVSLNPGAR